MFDVDTPTSPSPASFKARVQRIAAEILAQEGPFTVTLNGRHPQYASNPADATRWRLIEAERRARAETKYEGAIRSALAELETYAVHRGRSLERKGLTDEQLPSLDCMCAANKVVRLVESMARRLAVLERDAESRVERYSVTELGHAALAEAQRDTAAVASRFSGARPAACSTELPQTHQEDSWPPHRSPSPSASRSKATVSGSTVSARVR